MRCVLDFVFKREGEKEKGTLETHGVPTRRCTRGAKNIEGAETREDIRTTKNRPSLVDLSTRLDNL